jgi:hypothetical protein
MRSQLKQERLLAAVLFAVAGAATACSPGSISADASVGPSGSTSPGTGAAVGGGGASGGPNNTFDHPDVTPNLFNTQPDGPPEVVARLHGCKKMRVATLGNVLTTLGVNVNDSTQLSAGQLYSAGADTLGAPHYDQRVREGAAVSVPQVGKMQDIFSAAPVQILAAVPNLPSCTVKGTAISMFDANGNLTDRGIACLTGAPATPDQVTLANKVITLASSPQLGQRMAIAVVLSAAHTCE